MKAWLKKLRVPKGVLIGVTVVVLYGIVLWWMPDRMNLDDKQDRHNARWLVVSVGGGFVVAAGLLYTARTYRLTQRGQITDRFIKALERFGSEELYVRYGGVLALEQIVQDAPDQSEHAFQVLGVFVRARAPRRPTKSTGSTLASPQVLPDRPEEDLQAALTALTRPSSRRNVPADQKLVLARLHLVGVSLRGADLSGANLREADLTHADLAEANLRGALVVGADFSHANLIRANLSRAQLYDSNFDDAELSGADLSDMMLHTSYLNGAIWSRDTRWPLVLNGFPDSRPAEAIRRISQPYGDSGRQYRIMISDDDPAHAWARRPS